MRGTRNAIYFLGLGVVGFCLFCGWLVIESGFFGSSAQRYGPCILLQKIGGDQDAEKSDATAAPAE